jgi:hypothetical protein
MMEQGENDQRDTGANHVNQYIPNHPMLCFFHGFSLLCRPAFPSDDDRIAEKA